MQESKMEEVVVDCLKDYRKTYSWKFKGCPCLWTSLSEWIGCISVAFQELKVWPHQQQDNWNSYRNNDYNYEFIGWID